MKHFTFRPPFVPTVISVGLFFLFASLARWQFERLEESKINREKFLARLEEPAFSAFAPPGDPEDRRVVVEGDIDWSRYLLLAGRYMWQQPGYQLIVPVREQQGAGCVLVDLGWIPEDEVELILKREMGLPAHQRLEGVARAVKQEPMPQGTFPLEEGYQRRWARYAPFEMGRAVGCGERGWLVLEGQGLAAEEQIVDRLPPVGGWRAEPPKLPHWEYAMTWSSLSVLTVILWGTLAFQRRVSA